MIVVNRAIHALNNTLRALDQTGRKGIVEITVNDRAFDCLWSETHTTTTALGISGTHLDPHNPKIVIDGMTIKREHPYTATDEPVLAFGTEQAEPSPKEKIRQRLLDALAKLDEE